MTRLLRVDEEVARFALEVHLRERCPDWSVVFTNPTAGPWKLVLAPDETGRWGEVHRFEREALRPDLVAVNDFLRVLLVLEAKDSVDKLMTPGQVDKSVEATETILSVLARQDSNPFWGQRTTYTAVNGLLWGSEQLTSSSAIERLFAVYSERLTRVTPLRSLVGVECMRADATVRCRFVAPTSGVTVGPSLTAEQLLLSLRGLDR